ncbi:hypothetical protein DL770_006240 [Monosporascus sp. CRB-9-2]|nr:hypothetical protein DL770_006240 [Monosporascus sp. CRB-9-2]
MLKSPAPMQVCSVSSEATPTDVHRACTHGILFGFPSDPRVLDIFKDQDSDEVMTTRLTAAELFDIYRSRAGVARQRKRKMYTIWAPNFDFEFSMVVCDEAHLLKNKNSSIHKVVKSIPRRSLILCTATPVLNKPEDIRGYLLLAWPDAVANPIPEGFSYASLYGESVKELDIQHFDDFASTGFLARGEGLKEMLNPGLRLFPVLVLD